MAVYSQGSGIVHRFSSLFPHHRHVSIISHGMAVILSSRGSLSRITISTAQSISVTFEGLFKLSSHLGCCARVAPGWAFGSPWLGFPSRYLPSRTKTAGMHHLVGTSHFVVYPPGPVSILGMHQSRPTTKSRHTVYCLSKSLDRFNLTLSCGSLYWLVTSSTSQVLLQCLLFYFFIVMLFLTVIHLALQNCQGGSSDSVNLPIEFLHHRSLYQLVTSLMSQVLLMCFFWFFF